MKVSIITLQNVLNNYGSVLQAFATQEKLMEITQDVEIIDYWRKDITIKGCMKSNSPIKMFFKLPSMIAWLIMYRKFKEKYLNITPKSYVSSDDFKKFPVHDGLYCTGSDQVWNLAHSMDIGPLFLDFIPKGKRKFAYASSFGTGVLADKEVTAFKEHINQYEQISVREDSGLEILKAQFDYNDAVRIVDPTLAMPPEFWRKHAPISKFGSGYILVYCIHKFKSLSKYAKKLSNKTGLPLFCLCQSYHKIMYGCRNILIPTIFEFISLIDNASYVLTDSFHAMAFSMNLNTRAICIYPPGYPGRISDFLRLIGEERRAIKDFNDFDILSRPTDFDKVNRILAHERERTDEYLRSILYKE